MTSKQQIKDYWEERANADSTPQVTTNDIFLRKLELDTIIDTISGFNLAEGASLLDVGCGDGRTIIEVSRALPRLRTVGVDYSENMVRIARGRLADSLDLSKRVTFIVGDAIDLGRVCGDQTFDLVTSDRCLINLPSVDAQRAALAEIAGRTKPGGHFLAIENFVEGQDSMNELRRAVGLPEIPVRWHNLYFRSADFVAAAGAYFDLIAFKDFSSSYYFATRVIYSALCQMRGEQPNYEHEIHQIAVKLPWFGQFSPIRMAVLRRR